jgi:hypothetical protein
MMVRTPIYALCRVFKKNAICTEVNDLQAQCNIALLEGILDWNSTDNYLSFVFVFSAAGDSY